MVKNAIFGEKKDLEELNKSQINFKSPLRLFLISVRKKKE